MRLGRSNSEEESLMQCSACGTQLPVGTAYCPTCGSVTPYQVSSSGVSPTDTTVASSSAEPSQYPYTPSNPYATPSPTPPTPPPHRRRLSARSIALPIILVLLIVGAAGVLYFRTIPPSSQPQPHASPRPKHSRLLPPLPLRHKHSKRQLPLPLRHHRTCMPRSPRALQRSMTP